MQDEGPVGPDDVQVVFDDQHAVAAAGIVLPATLAARLGVEALVDQTVALGERPGAANPGAKILTLISAMALGADCIDDCDLLRAGRTGQVLGHQVAAPSTLGTFLRAFTFGHVRQLDRVLGEALTRAWQAGAGPGEGRLVIDVDSFVGEVHGYQKQGAAFGYTRQRGYHPLLATRADTREVLHIRLRKGSANTSRGMLRFCDELIARLARAGATGPKLLRADSGFWSAKTFARLAKAGWQYSIGVRLQPHVRAAVEQIDEEAWQTLEDYPPTSIAQIAETTLGEERLVVRRVRTLDQQGELLPSFEHFPFATNRADALALVEAEHRHPRPQGPGARALPLGSLLGQRRLDGHRLPRAQPPALHERAQVARPHRPRRPHRAPPTAGPARAADAQCPAMDAAPARPLVLAGGLHRGARPAASAPGARLSARRTLRTLKPDVPTPARSPLPRAPGGRTGGIPHDGSRAREVVTSALETARTASAVTHGR